MALPEALIAELAPHAAGPGALLRARFIHSCVPRVTNLGVALTPAPLLRGATSVTFLEMSQARSPQEAGVTPEQPTSGLQSAPAPRCRVLGQEVSMRLTEPRRSPARVSKREIGV